jgi:hypothetical protein
MGDGLGTSSQKRMGLDEEEKNLAQIYSAYVERKGWYEAIILRWYSGSSRYLNDGF